MSEVAIYKGPYLGDEKHYVRLAAYAALKAERDALAVENLALKVSRQDVVNAFDDATNEFGMARGETAANYPAPETPTTDAYANQLRAEGVEMAISGAFTDGIPVNRMQFIKRMTEFAANLRKENGHG